MALEPDGDHRKQSSGVRAAVAWSEETARLARQHNNANVMVIGARTTPAGQIPAIVRAWFSADFEGGRHAGRIEKIALSKQLQARTVTQPNRLTDMIYGLIADSGLGRAACPRSLNAIRSKRGQATLPNPETFMLEWLLFGV